MKTYTVGKAHKQEASHLNCPMLPINHNKDSLIEAAFNWLQSNHGRILEWICLWRNL